jgi:hypothetical protein
MDRGKHWNNNFVITGKERFLPHPSQFITNNTFHGSENLDSGLVGHERIHSHI